MDQKSLAYAKYWRTCLADADLGNGALKRSELKERILRPDNELQNGRVGSDLVSEFFKQSGEDVEEVNITIRPFIYHLCLEHGKARVGGIPEVVTPIVSQAVLDRQGRIYPNENTVIPRDILEPLYKGSFSVGVLAELDSWLARHDVPKFDKQTIGERDPDEWHRELWQKYLNYCEEMLITVSSNWPKADARFAKDIRWVIANDSDVVGASTHILALYDNIRSEAPKSSLFERYASEKVESPDPCHPSGYGFSRRLGHGSDTYPLADAQRDSLICQLVSEPGEILAVNGPPGTGKTTMLLSVVASYWVRAALNGGDPPVIVAASTNNQAVTNIIDAFGKDFSVGTGVFAGRWLPEIKSFGVYLPSASKEKQAAEKYQTRSFFSKVENQGYYEQAKASFLGKASKAFPGLIAPSIEDICAQLKRLIEGSERNLKAIETVWPTLLSATNAMRGEFGFSPEAGLVLRQSAVSAKVSELSLYKALMEKWEGFLGDESWVYTLLSWLPSVNRKRVLLAKGFLRELWPQTFPDGHWEDVGQFTHEIQTIIGRLNGELTDLQASLERGMKVVKAHREALTRWGEVTDCLGMETSPESRTLATCDSAADTVIRFPAFLYATHYWEARWLIEMKDLATLAKEKQKTSKKVSEKNWLRRMMLTPCAVSTFFMLPNEFKGRKYRDNNFADDYLYRFIDLLIVDEAGQVLPEVAGASFSLAKRALVIGDTFQIEPIWSITEKVDVGNLFKANLMDSTDDPESYERISKLGKSAASGSVMVIAQQATRYHYDKDLERGMYLYEHRRCYDEIVAYCNTLCYHNKLSPMRGHRPSTSVLPAMGYLQVSGKCERRGGSRANQIEAVSIAEWIVLNRPNLEEKYRKPIHDIVGVVTPFGGQVVAITEECVKRGVSVGKGEGKMTIGTVHSLQGAERLIVIFSPTYTMKDDGGFIDSRPSMLNVAVSRAKDSFLVFGDMSVFKSSDIGSPRGLLASFLFAVETNEISFDLLSGQKMKGPHFGLALGRNQEAVDAER